jgi:Rieske Fe-S protein
VSVPEADVPAGGALVLPQHRVAIVREAAAFFALDLTCTHLGCTVKATEQGFSCPCHGSRFGRAGDVVKGPAPRALTRLSLDCRDGIVRVSRG